jgi:hypothetical protein
MQVKKSYIQRDIRGIPCIYVWDITTEETIRKAQACKVKRIVLRSKPKSNIEALTSVAEFVTEIFIEDSSVSRKFIESFYNLESISFESPPDDVDLSKLKMLKACQFCNTHTVPPQLSNVVNLQSLSFTDSCRLRSIDFTPPKKLESLNLSGRNLVDDSEMWKPFASLKNLGLTDWKYDHLKFLAYLPGLVTCCLIGFPKVESLGGFARLGKLSDLQLVGWKRLADLGELRSLENLKHLLLESCPNIESLAPLAQLKRLETLNLWETTTIRDGKLRWIADTLNLDELVFNNRRHYDIKWSESMRKTPPVNPIEAYIRGTR